MERRAGLAVPNSRRAVTTTSDHARRRPRREVGSKNSLTMAGHGRSAARDRLDTKDSLWRELQVDRVLGALETWF